MTCIRLLRAALLAVLAVSALAASAAQAAELEAPWYGVEVAELEFARLGEGENREIKSSGTKTYELKTGKKITVTCTSEKAKGGGKLIGSKSGEPGTGEQVDEYSGCSVTGNGEACKVTEPIVTKTLKTELVFDLESQKLLTLLTPKEGTELASLSFSGTCTTKTTQLTGSVAAETLNEKGVAITTENDAGGELKEFLNFPTTGITHVVKVKAKKSEAPTEVGLKAFGEAATLVGRSEVSLASGKKFGGQPILNTLRFISVETPFKIPAGTTLEYTVEFRGIGRMNNGVAGLTNMTAFEVLAPMAGVTDCRGAQLLNGQSCAIKIKCKGVLNDNGEVKVTDFNAPLSASRTLLCT
jgi:hypothetical protein